MVAPALAAIALCLLAASGVAKLSDPAPTTGAMRAAGLPASRLLSHLFGLSEILVASLALVFAGVGVALAALFYAAFSAFTVSAIRSRIPVQTCGCFGRADTPPSLVHVIFNVIATVALLTTALLGWAPINWTLPLLDLILYLSFALTGAYASYLLMTRLPQLGELARAR